MPDLLSRFLPEWAQPDHPLLRYELAHVRHYTQRRGLLYQVTPLCLLLLASAIIYAVAVYQPARTFNIIDLLWNSLYYPALLLQLITLISALSLGTASVGAERSHKTWDNLRVTEDGAAFALRARWIGILYRLRAPIIVILLVRLLLILGMLVEMPAFGGIYGEMLAAAVTPPLADWRIGLLLIALGMAVIMLLPLVAIAVAAAFGILLAVAVKERVWVVLIQLLLALGQITIVAAGKAGVDQVLREQLMLSDGLRFALVFGYSGFGDWGLQLAHLGSLGEIWGIVPYGASFTLALAVLLGLYALAADGMMWLAARLSESRG